MPCYDNYITIDGTTPSRSGLYAVDLPGVDLSMLSLLTKEDQADYEEFWVMIYKKAWDNLIADVSAKLQKVFYIDTKIVSRETSKYKTGLNSGSALAGVTIEFKLPKYAKIHIVSVDVKSAQDYASPEVVIEVYDTDADGDLLSTTMQEVSEGKNTIFIDQDYDVDKVFVAYDPAALSFYQTENKRYDTSYLYWSCDACEFNYCGSYTGIIKQVGGGGLNVKFNVVCSIDKFVCENINLFKQAFYYRIGLELVTERRFGNRLNKYMTMTLERQEELMGFYNAQYTQFLSVSLDTQQMDEDPYCFRCKELVSKRGQIP